MFKNYKKEYEAQLEIVEELSEMFGASTDELRFANLLTETLKNALEEIESITNDKLVKAVARNTLERYNLDKLAHARVLFPDPQ